MKDKIDVQEIQLDRIDPFPNHPYRVADDEDMEQLTESIRAKGVLVPCIVRKMPHERYEMVAGHRRMHACRLLGLESLPAVVMDLSKDEAAILMVESNFQRDHLLPSEKAFAYKIRLEAMKMQISRMRENQKKGQNYRGKPTAPQIEAASDHLENAYGLSREEIERIGNAASRRKDYGKPYEFHPHELPQKNQKKSKDHGTVCPVGTHICKKTSAEKLSDDVGESKRQIYRYIRLTELLPELLKMVDEGKMGLRTGVELSYLGPRQRDVLDHMEREQCVPTQAQGKRLRKLFQAGELTQEKILEILGEAKPNQVARLVLHGSRFDELIPCYLSGKKREDYVADALEYYQEYQSRVARGLIKE